MEEIQISNFYSRIEFIFSNPIFEKTQKKYYTLVFQFYFTYNIMLLFFYIFIRNIFILNNLFKINYCNMIFKVYLFLFIVKNKNI